MIIPHEGTDDLGQKAKATSCLQFNLNKVRQMEKRSDKANVFLWDNKAGLLERTDAGYRFTYYNDYLSLPDAQPVSLTLPLAQKPYKSKQLFPFFVGLLPEGWYLNIVCRTLKIDPKSSFDLLLGTCGECVGAVSVFPIHESDAT